MIIYKVIPVGDKFEIALVKSPAIEQEFIAFSEQKKNDYLKYSIEDEEKKQVVGPVMIPGLVIERYNESIGTYYTVYDEEGVELAARIFFKNGAQFNIDHNSDNDALMEVIESWILKYDDYELMKGTWMLRAQITDDNLWNEIKAGTWKGFSVEGIFEMSEIIPENGIFQFNKEENKQNKTMIKEKLMEKFKTIIDDLFFEEQKPVEQTVVEEVKVDEQPEEQKVMVEEVEQKQEDVKQEDVKVDEVKVDEVKVDEVKEVEEQKDEKYDDLNSKYSNMELMIAELKAEIEKLSKVETSVSVKEEIPNKINSDSPLAGFLGGLKK